MTKPPRGGSAIDFHFVSQSKIESEVFNLQLRNLHIIMWWLQAAARVAARAGSLLVGNTHILFNTRRGDIKLGQMRVATTRWG